MGHAQEVTFRERLPVLAATGEPISVGPIESMSKSKKNVVDPDDIISAYGADTARWFMLSDTPPERDIEWTAGGVDGAFRFLQRIWRLVNEAAEKGAGAHRRLEFSADGLGASASGRQKRRRRDHGHRQTPLQRRHRQYLRTLQRAFRSPQFGQRQTCAGHAIFPPGSRGNAHPNAAPMVPHLVEENVGRRSGIRDFLAEQAWPTPDPGLLTDDTVTIAVQVNGKRRDELRIARDAAREY